MEKQVHNEISGNGLDLIQKLCKVHQKTVGNVMECVIQGNVSEIELSKLSCKEVYFIKELNPIYRSFMEELKSN